MTTSTDEMPGVIRDRFRLLVAISREEASGRDVDVVVDVRDALDALPRGQRVCVILRYGMAMSEADVADILNISTGTVKSQTSRGAKRLRALLDSKEAVTRG